MSPNIDLTYQVTSVDGATKAALGVMLGDVLPVVLGVVLGV